jgi:chromosome segregation ATPase
MAKIKPAAANGQQTIEELQARYNRLNTEKIRASTNLENSQKELDRLKADAREKYGTDDIAALQQKLQQMKDDNEQKRAEYQSKLDAIETELEAVEKKFASAESPAAPAQ